MNRVRDILGLVVGGLLVLSSLAHSLMGWPVQRAALAASNVSPELAGGLGAGWNFAGAAMLAFGIVVLHTFIGRVRGVRRPRFAAQVASLLWLLFGLYAYATTRTTFFLVAFTLPGVLLALASFGREDESSS